MNILITGASGLIGQRLTSYLIEKGHCVAHLRRGKGDRIQIKQFNWDLKNGIMDVNAISWADAIVHLAGANVSEGKWTTKRKKEIIDSRVLGAELLNRTIQNTGNKVKVIVSASAVGWYGMITSDKIFVETDAPGSDFFGDCCQKWESAMDVLTEQHIRIVKLRIGVVLSKDGGALPKLAGPIRYFVGSPLGTGKQWMPWIHIDDLCELFYKALLDEQMKGSYNAASGTFTTNRDFVKTIGRILSRPILLPAIPKFILKLFLGEMSGIVTEGSRVSNLKLLKAGFVFKYNELEPAVRNLLK